MDIPRSALRSLSMTLQRLWNYLKDHWIDYTDLFLIAGIVISLDQWLKEVVRVNLPLGSDWLPTWLSWLQPYARIRHWSNTGAAFGFFQQGNKLIMALAIFVSLAIIYLFPRTRRKDWSLRLAMGLQMGGAVGNLVDRFMYGRVTDFISIANFPIFNIADSSISVGVVVLLASAWFKERADKKRLAILSEQETQAERVPEEDEGRRG